MSTGELKTIELSGHTLTFELKRHARTRRANLTIYPSGRILVTIPMHKTERAAHLLLRREMPWILKNLKKIQSKERVMLPKIDRSKIAQYKKKAHSIIKARVMHYNTFYKFPYNRISVRSQKTLWGSCSHNKNLNFNYCLIFLPEYLRDYVIVHELCHLKEHNHGKSFWQLVENLVPRYKECEKNLKHYVIS